jgi:hypothetical protein
MSICTHRKPGIVNKDRMMCAEKLGRCPWPRAMVCIPCDLIKYLWGKTCGMLFPREEGK